MRGFSLFFLILLFPINVYSQCYTSGRECTDGTEAGCFHTSSNVTCDQLGATKFSENENELCFCTDGTFCPVSREVNFNTMETDRSDCPDGTNTAGNSGCDSITDCRFGVTCPNAGSACAAFCNNDYCATQTVKCKNEDDAYVENSSYYLDSNGNCQQYGDLLCSDFLSGCSGTVDGDAIHVDSGQYDVSECRCTSVSWGTNTYGDRYSYTKILKPNNESVGYDWTIVYDTFVSGTYNYTGCGDNRCYDTDNQNASINIGTDTYSCNGEKCSCIDVADGLYVDGNYCRRCSPGQTSNEHNRDCHYTSSTVFCDATGQCVSGIGQNN